jgi:DNA-binding transcriptional LysR family regulator
METLAKHLEDLVAFHLVATEGGFTRAAEARGVSKANLSKQVQRLEAMLRTRLFHRSTRSVRLTEEGSALLAYTRQILGLSEEAGRRLQDLAQGAAGTIRISTTVSFGDVFFPSFLEAIRPKLPGVRFDCDLSNEPRDFRREEIDFAIRAADISGGEHDGDLIARYLGKLRDVICAAPAVARRAPKNPEGLAQADCILTSVDEGWNAWNLVSSRGETRVQAGGTVSTNQYALARRYAVDGLGIARLPVYIAQNDLDARQLVQLFPEYQIATHPLYLVYPKTGYVSRRHKLVRDEILAWFKRRPEIFA